MKQYVMGLGDACRVLRFCASILVVISVIAVTLGCGDDETGESESTSSDSVEDSFADCDDPLESRVSQATLALPAKVLRTDPWLLDPTPVILSIGASGDGLIGWVDDMKQVHFTEWLASDALGGEDLVIAGDDLRGLTAADEGAAALVVMGDEMHLVGIEKNAITFDTRIVGGKGQAPETVWVDGGGYNGRLVWNGSFFGAYFGISGLFERGIYQGDTLVHLDGGGRVAEGGWDWGCSRSDDVRIVPTDANGGFTSVCASDVFPCRGICLNESDSGLFFEPDNDGKGRLRTRLGGLVSSGDRLWLSFTTPLDRASDDVALASFQPDGSDLLITWLTDNFSNESKAKLAPYGDGFFVAWQLAEMVEIAILDKDGQIIMGPVEIDAQLEAGADLTVHPNEDIGWVYYPGEDRTTLSVVRVQACK